MLQPPVPKASSRAHTGAKRLNGAVWGLVLLAALAVVATSGGYAALIPLLLLLPLAGVGIMVNLVLCCWKLATGRFRQALGYGLGFVLLALFWLGLHLHLRTHRVEKWW